MVGGLIREIVKVSPARWWVDCLDHIYFDRCAIYLNPAGHDIRLGDALWWQGGAAMWTPRVLGAKDHDASRGKADTRLEKIGYSGVLRPEADVAREFLTRTTGVE